MFLVMSKTKGAKSTIHTVQTVHITFTFMRIGMNFTLNEEFLTKQRFQPWRPASKVFIFRSTSTLSNKNIKKENKPTFIIRNQKIIKSNKWIFEKMEEIIPLFDDYWV